MVAAPGHGEDRGMTSSPATRVPRPESAPNDGRRAMPRRPPTALVVAAVAGVAHGAFSLYWALGGDWLLATVGQRMIEQFSEARWLLLPVGLVKIAAALSPALLAATGWPLQRLSRLVCWAGAVLLLVWGVPGWRSPSWCSPV